MRYDVERVEREDIVMFLNASRASTAQNEFYTSGWEHAVALNFLHTYICGNYRALYARALAVGINDRNRQQIIWNLLRRGAPKDPVQRTQEGALIEAALEDMPPPRAYRCLAGLSRGRINNRRARAVCRDYVRRRPNLALHALKYRRWLKIICRHAHLDLPAEIRAVLFEDWRTWPIFETPLLETYRQAHYAKSMVYQLPMTVAEGLAAKHGIARATFLKKIKGRMTRAERERSMRQASRQKIDLEVDLGRMDATRLALYILGLGKTERRERRDEFEGALLASGQRATRGLRLGHTALVWDTSYSSAASRERARRPLAVGLGLWGALRACSQRLDVFTTAPIEHPVLATPRGQTALGRPLLDALESGAQLIILVSDGYENDPPGGVDMIARMYYEHLDPGRRVKIVHFNPVFDPGDLCPRRLSSEIPTVGVRGAHELETLLATARFEHGSWGLQELIEHMDARAEAMTRGVRR